MPFGTLRSSGRIWEFKNLVTATGMIVMILALTGCGLLPFGNSASPHAPAPPVQTQSQSQSDSQSPSPEGYEQIQASPPVTPIVTLSPTPMDPVIATGALQLGLEGSPGSLGLNLDEYFDKNADIETRVTHVERAVTAIHKDLKTLLPPIRRLITVESDIQALVSQLTELTQNPSSAEASPQSLNKSVRQSPPPRQASRSSPNHRSSQNHISGGYQGPAIKGAVTVRHLRIGEHSTKTRIVLDVSGPASYSYDLDNEEGLFVIELPHAGWSGKTQWKSSKSPLLASYNVYATESGGSRVVVQLKKGTQVSYETVIKANGNKNYRIVIDLKK